MMEDWEIEATLRAMDYDAEPIEVPVRFILERANDSCDWGSSWGDRTEWWLNGIMQKAADTGFGHLIESILTDGWQENSAIGFDGDYITEGHHRLVAAILLCLDTVLVCPGGNSGRDTVCAHWNDDDPNPVHL